MTFLFPWMLAALSVVPVLWWLLRVMPPRPKTVRFPAFFLLKDLQANVTTAARTPWWLMVLRSLIVILFILALAGPVRQMGEGLPGRGGSVLIAVDNGWAGAANWKKRIDKINELLPQVGRSGRAVVFLPTAPSAEDGKVHAYGPMNADEAKQWIGRLSPQPWATDPAAARSAFKDFTLSYSVYMNDGTTSPQTSDFMQALQAEAGGVMVVHDDEVNTPFILKHAGKKAGELVFDVQRLDAVATGKQMALAAFDAGGGVVDEFRFEFPAGKKETQVTWDMPADLGAKVERVALRSPAMASAVFLTDARWRRKPVGIVSDAASKESKSFLNEVYYLRRAMEEGGSISVDSVDALLAKKMSVIVWPDSAALPDTDRAALAAWVEQGGFLIRFAGPALAANPEDTLLPVKLRYGQRSMEGAMTWEKPVKMGPIPEDSPLYGLDVPQDVTVTRQVLADPVPESFERTWLQLEDGTPLVTGGEVGKGVVALIHTTAGPGWSDFCYSGLYVETLQRMVSLSNGISDYKAENVLPPLMLMDGFGQLRAPEEKGFAVPVDPKAEFTPSPATPPGLYGDRREFQVFNLGDHLSAMKKLESIPANAEEDGYALSGERDLKPDFFRLALLLLLIDTLVTLALRGVFTFSRGAAAVALLLVLMSHPARAQEVDEADLASGIYLAYVETGDQETDQTSYNGLTGLAEVLKLRTTVRVKGVRAVDPSADKLYFYPFLYWPMTEAQHALAPAAVQNLQGYMSEGGMIVFDTRDAQFGETGAETPGTRKLRELTQGLRIPELAPVGEGHILTKSFYLLDSFPGRFAGGKLWVEKEPNQSFDAVTSVIIGSGDYAAAWSRDPGDQARFYIEPGGERQREMARRVGVNIVMTSLTGNYKADQVHVPYILQRIGR